MIVIVIMGNLNSIFQGDVNWFINIPNKLGLHVLKECLSLIIFFNLYALFVMRAIVLIRRKDRFFFLKYNKFGL